MSRFFRSGRLIVGLALLLGLVVGVGAAYAALGAHDTAYGTGALAVENGGDYNTAVGNFALNSSVSGSYSTAVGASALHDSTVGYNTAVGVGALYHVTTGQANTAVGWEAGNVGNGNQTGSYNSFFGNGAGATATLPVDYGTAIGANAIVTQDHSVVLGTSNEAVGIHTTAPQSTLQVGNGLTGSFGDYLQVPVVDSTAKTPPPADCNATNLVGRLVMISSKKKVTVWACGKAGVWVKV